MPDVLPAFEGTLSRRQVLASAAVISGAGVLLSAVGLPSGVADAVELHRWSDPATWGGTVPEPGAAVTIDKDVLLDVDAATNGVLVLPGASLTFDPAVSRTLTSSGNVELRNGTLRMRPSSAAVEHVLRFVNVDEAAFVGGGMTVTASDVGLWAMEGSSLELDGCPKLAWARAAGSVPAGANRIELLAVPTGWGVGDELALTPSGGASASSWDHYDSARIVKVEGLWVTLDRPTTHSHPATDVGDGIIVGCEVLNLTRNVRVEGTPEGRSHIWASPTGPQQLSYVAIRWMGPRQKLESATVSVLGRYGLHLHMAGDGSRGSVIEGVVVRDTGGHAFVPHASHGVTLRSCISHDTVDDAFWYDGAPDTRTPGANTNDLAIVACVASRVRVEPAFRGFRLAGFLLGAGSGNRMSDCVAVGVQGNGDASGFGWPEGPTSGVWDFRRCVAHNNKRHGIFTWQNTSNAHVVREFVSAHNGGGGVAHGAYVNTYAYEDGYLYGNLEGGVLLHSNSVVDGAGAQRFTRLHVDSAGLADHAFQILKHTLDPGGATRIEGCRFLGQRRNAVAFTFDGGSETTVDLLDLVDNTSTTPLLWLSDVVLAGSRVRVQQGTLARLARPVSFGGAVDPDWNAVVSDIATFAPSSAATPRPVTLGHGALLLVTTAGSEVSIAPTVAPSPTSEGVVHDHTVGASPSPVRTRKATTRWSKPKPRQFSTASRLTATDKNFVLQLANTDSKSCLVDVLVDGRVRLRSSVPAGGKTLQLRRTGRNARVTVLCHGERINWRVSGRTITLL